MNRRVAIVVMAVVALVLAVWSLSSRQSVTLATPPSSTVVRVSATPTASPTKEPTYEDSPPADPDRIPRVTTAPDWVNAAIWIAMVLLALGVVLWIASKLRLAPKRPVATGTEGDVEALSEEDREELEESLAASLERLQLGAGLNEAIIDCWLAVETVAGRQGVPRQPSQTAEEYSLAVLARTPAGTQDMTVLADLYRAAMFAGRTLTTADRERAVAALTRLLADLRGEVADPRPRRAAPEADDA